VQSSCPLYPRKRTFDGARRKAMLSWWRRNKFSASIRPRDLNMSTMNIPSAYRIANIDLNDAMILLYDANLSRMEFLERTVVFSAFETIILGWRRNHQVSVLRRHAHWHFRIAAHWHDEQCVDPERWLATNTPREGSGGRLGTPGSPKVRERWWRMGGATASSPLGEAPGRYVFMM
jgi:hypothetical protein